MLIPEGHHLFIVDLEYVKPMAEVEAVIEPHMAFIRASLAEGWILTAGRKVPRSGGLIVAVGESRAAVEAQFGADPFLAAGVAQIRITEFVPSTRAPGFA